MAQTPFGAPPLTIDVYLDDDGRAESYRIVEGDIGGRLSTDDWAELVALIDEELEELTSR